MRKLCSLILALLLLAGLLAACSGHNLPTLSESKRLEIGDAWFTQSGFPLTWHSLDSAMEKYNGARYYGSYGQYDVLFISKAVVIAPPSPYKVTIGTEAFTHTEPFELYAYRNGEFSPLIGIYGNGLISDAELAEIAKLHRACEEEWKLT